MQCYPCSLLSQLPTLSLTLFLIFGRLNTAPVNKNDQALAYLQKFGFLEEAENSGSGTANILSADTFNEAVMDFQRFNGLKETGQLDNATMQMMSKPRCGVKDRIGHSDLKRRKRYAVEGSKWKKSRLTYRISKYASKIKGQERVDKVMAAAFKVWSDFIPLSFVEKKRGRVNIDIRFLRGHHGDGNPFDGPGKTLAHAGFPQQGGDVHFDDEEKWVIDEKDGTDLYLVAAHEFGHSLGLGHSMDTMALMAPYVINVTSLELHQDDITAIQTLYGKRSNVGTSTPPQESPGNTNEDSTTQKESTDSTNKNSTPSKESSGSTNELATPPEPSVLQPDIDDAPDLCQDAVIDAIARTENGSAYVFRGDFYWKIRPSAEGLVDGYPRIISDDWGGLPGNLDASLTWSSGKTFFFKGDRYWRFINRRMDKGYPKLIRVGFEGIPDEIDAAFVWSGNGKTYFFKGDEFWRFDSHSDPPVSRKYPQPISKWNGLPNNIDAAFQWENGLSYFFKNDKYYRFNDATFEIEKADPPYPRSTAIWWFQCRTISRGTDRNGKR